MWFSCLYNYNQSDSIKNLPLSNLSKETVEFFILLILHSCSGANKLNNVFIAKAQDIYINPLGINALAKGGSGDVLSGLIGALLAQGYNGLDSALQGSLAHTLAAREATKHIANYALTPSMLIESITTLQSHKRIHK